ncbi:TMEM165/GDT1 family protein [Ferrimonas balearica]|uniref:TMEM165/GDT1 family protein n=1 Tax=Ferrimonas balearica TaxID=44012 RepID=UPI001C596D69|nr:TMEM165/GDT1 family protein [Ferrimonas balearica]MBW3140709.1 TMEM165/GDT1 family protein [Ferrimonas balearica]MBY6018866.1 TMEM165/GDT1 family protein [Halomonas denitrificans]MBY6096056.1 TMEM165/GDT1 family protein [Ferrimonas balearica]MBY6107486.1 TMEM165/GDT1 family protein [Ferrimonas balearica]
MEALFSSTLAVAIAEIGDKTQLLAFILATRFHKPLVICLGILAATLLNHAAAAYFGAWLGEWLNGDLGRYLLAGSFLAMAAWMLIPDKVEAEESPLYRFGPFVATFILFFLAEIGDKTQIATVLLAAKYDAMWMVITGTTIGMLLANVPVVLAGKLSADKLPMVWIHRGSAALFAAFGVVTLFSV